MTWHTYFSKQKNVVAKMRSAFGGSCSDGHSQGEGATACPRERPGVLLNSRGPRTPTNNYYQDHNVNCADAGKPWLRGHQAYYSHHLTSFLELGGY